MAAKVVNSTSLSGITLLPIDDPSQSKLFCVRRYFQLWSSFLRLLSDIAIALPSSARTTIALWFGLIAFHTTNPDEVRG